MLDTGITIKLYSFSDLSKAAREKVLFEHRNFLLSVMNPHDYENNNDFTTDYIYYDQNDEPIIASIEANKYLFFEDGNMAYTITYCGSHPLAGETHFMYMGHDYKIKGE